MIENKDLKFIELKENLFYTEGGYRCVFIDKRDNEYIGLDAHSPHIARIRAKINYKFRNPNWKKFISQEFLNEVK